MTSMHKCGKTQHPAQRNAWKGRGALDTGNLEATEGKDIRGNPKITVDVPPTKDKMR